MWGNMKYLAILFLSVNASAYTIQGNLLVTSSATVNASLTSGQHQVNGQETITSTMTVQGSAFSVGGSALVVTNGNVGIGTTSPQFTLDVNGISRFSSYQRFTNGSGPDSGYIGDNNQLVGGVGGDMALYSVHNFRFYTANSGTPVLYVSTTNIGIGNTSPVVLQQNQLSSTGGFPATSGAAQPNAELRLRSSNAGAVLDMGSDGAVTAAGWIQAADGTSLATSRNLILEPNGGNVGIGMTSPSTPLSVQGVITSSTTIPQVSCTAGSGTMTAGSGTNFGSFVAGTLSTACTVTFTNQFPNNRVFCQCQATTNVLVYASAYSSTAVTCTSASALTGDTITYACQGQP